MLRVPWRLSAAFLTEGHCLTCFSYCSFIFFSSVFVLFISLRQLCEFFFVFFCLALLLAYFSPPQIFTAASAAFHCRPRRWCKGAGLLPGKLGELSTAAQALSCILLLALPPLSPSPCALTVLLACCDPGLPPLCCRIELTSDLTSL